jgi:hypothetical protein
VFQPDSRSFAFCCSYSDSVRIPESGELVINDFTRHGTDDLVVVDIRSGELLDRVDTGSRIANGMFLTPGGNRDVFYCTTLCVARAVWH